MKVFTNINNFLNMCVDYLDLRVRNGKFIGDLEELEHKIRTKTQEKITKIEKSIKTSQSLKSFLDINQKQWDKIIKIPVLGEIAFIIVRTLSIVLRSFIDYGILVSLCYLTFIALLTNFQTSALIFCLMLLPIVWINGLLHGLLFFMIDKRDRHEEGTLVAGIKKTFGQLSSFIVLISLHIFTLFTIAISFILIAFALSEIFQAIHLEWEHSYIYWDIVVPIGILTAIALFIFNIIAYQSYFWVIIQRQKPFHALRSAWTFFKQIPFQLSYFHLLILGCFTVAIPVVYNTSSIFGITLLIFASGHGLMLINYILRKQYLQSEAVDERHIKNEQGLFLAFFGLGSITFFLCSLLFIRQYPLIQNQILKDQEAMDFASEVVVYHNDLYGYDISYPKNWTVYHYDTEPNVPTIYNNYSGSREGGIWIKITVQDVGASNYTDLKAKQSGLVITDPSSKTELTKIEDITMQGYPGIKYVYNVPTGANPQFQTHYLINKNDKVYDIVFITVNQIVENDNAQVFENILNTFKFVN